MRGGVAGVDFFDVAFCELKRLGPGGAIPKGEVSIEPAPRVAFAIKVLRSERELRRLGFFDFSVFFSSGGEAPIVLSLDCCPCELEGRSSKAPMTVGLSRETGLLGDSIDFDRLRDPLERLDGPICSPVATLRPLDLLSVRHTEWRSLSLLFERRRVSANLLRNEDAFEVRDPVAEWFDRLPEIDPYVEFPPLPKAVMAPGPISSNNRSESTTKRSNKLI